MTMKFQLIEQIGRGSHGTVYKGKFKGEVVAIKQICRKNHSQSQWMNEVNIMRALESANPTLPISKVLHTEAYDANMYIVMNYIQGINGAQALRQMKKDDEYTSPETLKRWLYDICKVCYTSHQMGILYNDFKPQNIIINETKKLHVIDFGSAREYHKGHTSLVGTPYFYSPEKCMNDYSFKADVWSIGVLVYMLGCGAHPFLEKHNIENLTEMQHILHINKLDFHLPQWDIHDPMMKDILASMMDKNEQNRCNLSDVLSHDYFSDVVL
jgi:serine/threonine protein kinase